MNDLPALAEPIALVDRFCVYGVATDYAELLEIIRYRVDEMNTTHESLDDVSGLHSGYSGKILADIRSLGKVSMGPVFGTTGLAMIVVRDDERFARIKDRLAKRERPKQLANASSTKPTWLFKRTKAREMGKKRLSSLTAEQLKKLRRKMGIASGKARRAKARAKRRQAERVSV